MKDPIVNQCCFCFDLRKGNQIIAFLQIFGSLSSIFNGILSFNNHSTQKDFDELEKQGQPSILIDFAKESNDLPKCKYYLLILYSINLIKLFFKLGFDILLILLHFILFTTSLLFIKAISNVSFILINMKFLTNNF